MWGYECGSINYEKGSIMAYRILGSDFGDFVTSNEEIYTSSQGENFNQIKLITPKGNINYFTQTLHEQLSIQEAHYHLQDDVHINGKGDQALLEIQFNLSDKGIFYKDKSQKGHLTPARSGNIMFLSAEENQADILFRKDVQYNTFDIHLPLNTLNRYAGESKLMDSFISQIHKDISGIFSNNKIGISPAIYNVLQEIKTCTYEGLTRKIYLESKAYELIALLYESVEKPKQDLELSASDQERLHEAASIIRNNLENPFTIIELSQKVGINQTKLKTGFKALFGNTVFGYLQDIRMHQAKRYLLDTQMSVQEISLLVGYQSTSNFSIAFKKTHGYSPTKLREK